MAVILVRTATTTFAQSSPAHDGRVPPTYEVRPPLVGVEQLVPITSACPTCLTNSGCKEMLPPCLLETSTKLHSDEELF